ncbi:MAG: hypothetical protein ACREIF_18795 [Chthoniobacterales bacterium]
MNNRYSRRFGWVCLVFLSFFLGLAMAERASAEGSGVEGIISVSPSRPGPQRINEPSKAPAAKTAFVVKKGAATVASFTTDAEGHFQVSLPPGHYLICREDPGAAIGHWRFEVDVVAGKMTTVDWTGDSGMR